MCGFLSGGNVNDVTVPPSLWRVCTARPVLADIGYDGDRFQRELETSGNVPVISVRKNRKVPTGHDEELHKVRGITELVFGG